MKGTNNWSECFTQRWRKTNQLWINRKGWPLFVKYFPSQFTFCIELCTLNLNRGRDYQISMRAWETLTSAVLKLGDFRGRTNSQNSADVCVKSMLLDKVIWKYFPLYIPWLVFASYLLFKFWFSFKMAINKTYLVLKKWKSSLEFTICLLYHLGIVFNCK